MSNASTMVLTYMARLQVPHLWTVVFMILPSLAAVAVRQQRPDPGRGPAVTVTGRYTSTSAGSSRVRTGGTHVVGFQGVELSASSANSSGVAARARR